MRFLAIAVLAAGCGASLNIPGTGSCTATLSGAVTETNVTCFAVAGTDSNGDGNGTIAFTFENPVGYTVSAAVKSTGTPAARNYANTDANANGACEVMSNGGSGTPSVWAAIAGGSPNQGTYSFNVTNISSEVSNPDGGPGQVFLTVHGTIDCTMPAVAGSAASGTVTMHATF
jgi:hypothetical protein